MVTGDVPCNQLRLELGVYLLGALEPAQRAVVDRHLAACPSCRAELSGLAGLPSLLRRVPADVARNVVAGDAAQAMPGPTLNALLARASTVRHRRRFLAVAAALVTGIVAASAVQAAHDALARPPVAAPHVLPVIVQAANPATGIQAEVRYTAQPWGTELEVSITGVATGTQCALLVTGQRGKVISAGGWNVAAVRQPTWYPESVPIQAAGLRRFTITGHGRTLVTIPARPASR